MVRPPEFTNTDLFFHLYPNPTSEQLVLENPNLLEVEIHIFSSTGRLMSSTPTNQPKLLLNLTEYAKGIYFITINNEVVNQVFKVVKF